MTKTSTLLAALASCLVPALVLAQAGAGPQGHGEGLDPAEILRPLADSWPTYSGDYSGKRYSALTQINQSNVRNLALAWVSRVTAGPSGGVAGGQGAAPAAPTIVGGEGTGDVIAGGATNVKGAVLAVNGILYFTTPDNAWAVDARDGREIWHYFWKTKGGTHIGNRGMGMWAPTCSSRRPTTTSSRWTRERGRSGGIRKSPASRRNISPRWRRL